MTETSAATQTVTLDLWVHYGQAYLIDDTDDAEGPDGLTGDHPTHPVGIIRVGDGHAFLITGTHTGTVGFTVAVSESEPDPDMDGYEDIVEVSFESEAGSVSLHPWEGSVHEIPELPAGPGWYRLRYHATGMDEAHEGSDEYKSEKDRYLLQIWPAAESDPRVVKSTSSSLSYWRSPR